MIAEGYETAGLIKDTVFPPPSLESMKKAPPPFEPFPKLPRLSREILITEKIDGTNAQVAISEYGEVFAGSRNRWLSTQDDNYGFAGWVKGNREELLKLGPGRHYGEWYGKGIQRGYGLTDRRFVLFNAERWAEGSERPECCQVVPILYHGIFDNTQIQYSLSLLARHGSIRVPGYTKPEGIVIFHKAAGIGFKKLLENDELPKGMAGDALEKFTTVASLK